MGLNPLQQAVALFALLGSLASNPLSTGLACSGGIELSSSRESVLVSLGRSRFSSEDSSLEEAVRHLEGVVRDSIQRELRARLGSSNACDCCLRLGLSGYLTGFASATVSTGIIALVVACCRGRSPGVADVCTPAVGETPVVTRSRRGGALADLAVDPAALH